MENNAPIKICRDLTKREREFFRRETFGFLLIHDRIFLSLLIFLTCVDLFFLLLTFSFPGENLFIAPLVLTAVTLFLLWQFRRSRKSRGATESSIKALTVISVEGELRKEMYRQFKTVSEHFYLGRIPVRFPEYWGRLGYLKEGGTYSCECAVLFGAESPPVSQGELPRNIRFVNNPYIIAVEGRCSLEAELKRGLAPPAGGDGFFPFLGALLLGFLFVLGALNFSYEDLKTFAAQPEKQYRFLRYGRIKERNAYSSREFYSPGEVPYDDLIPYLSLNLRNGLFLKVREEGRVVVRMAENPAAFRERLDALQDRAKILERWIWPRGFYYTFADQWVSIPELEKNPHYLGMKEAYIRLGRAYPREIFAYLSTERRPLPAAVIAERERILEEYYEPLVRSEGEALLEELRALFARGEGERIYLRGDAFSAELPVLDLPDAEKLDFLGHFLSDYFEDLQKSVEAMGERRVSGVLTSIEEGPRGPLYRLSLAPEDRYDTDPLSQAILVLILLLLGSGTVLSARTGFKRTLGIKRHLKQVAALYGS